MKKSTPRKPVLAPQLSIGLDLGSREAVACSIRRDGSVLERMTIAMTPAAMTEVFRGQERCMIVLESCGQSGWVARLLEELGHDVLPCNARRLKLIAASTLKTDKLDAEILGRLARLSQLDPELVRSTTTRSRETQLKRSSLTVRDQLVATRTRHVTTVRSILREDALPVPHCDASAFAAKVARQELPDDVRAAVEPLLAMIVEANRQIAAVEARIGAFAREMPVVERLREIDGVGLLTSVAFALTIEDPKRFERSRDVGPYLGLTPKLRQSSETEWRGGCTKQGDERVRRYLVQAALGLLRCRRDSALKTWGLAVAARRGRKKAIVGLARKLAVVMHHLWISEEDYVPFPTREVTRAA